MDKDPRPMLTAVGDSPCSEGERSETERNGGAPTAARELSALSNRSDEEPDPEVIEKPRRRRFAAKYKLKVLQEAERCSVKGQLGALLRREGLYHSTLSSWRRQREKGELKVLGPQKRGNKTKRKDDPLVVENVKLQRENRRLQARLKQAEIIIDVQKKISEMLGIPLNPPESEEKD